MEPVLGWLASEPQRSFDPPSRYTTTSRFHSQQVLGIQLNTMLTELCHQSPRKRFFLRNSYVFELWEVVRKQENVGKTSLSDWVWEKGWYLTRTDQNIQTGKKCLQRSYCPNHINGYVSLFTKMSQEVDKRLTLLSNSVTNTPCVEHRSLQSMHLRKLLSK